MPASGNRARGNRRERSNDGSSSEVRSKSRSNREVSSSRDAKFDLILSGLQGLSQQVANSSAEVSKLKTQMDLQLMRCDQLTTNMQTMGNDIHSRITHMEGIHAACTTDLRDSIEKMNARVCDLESSPTPIAASDSSSAASSHVQKKIADIEEKLSF
eukprot:4159210-Pyramimonas_sp.AAC.1